MTHRSGLSLSIIICSPEIPLPSDGFLFDLLEPWDVRVLSIRKTGDLPLQLWAIGFYFLSETLIYSTAKRENAKSVSFQGLSQRGINEKAVQCLK